MPFGQLIIGPPGSGKSTYAAGMHQFLSAIGRKSSIVNLDPANDPTPNYPVSLDIRDLVSLESIMRDDALGPNGGVLYALEELEENAEWLEEGLRGLGEDYVLFDCPGQVELFTHHGALRNVLFRLQKLGYRVVVNLLDSYVLTLPSLYVSGLLLSLRTMLQLELPHINVLTKIDNLTKYPPLPFNLDFYTEVQDLSYLLPKLTEEAPVFAGGKFEALNNAVVELVEEFGLVSFETLAVEDKKSMMSLMLMIDKAGGYAFGGAEGANDTIWQVAVREGIGTIDVRDVQERWLDAREDFDEKERREAEEEAERRQKAMEGSLPGQSDIPEDAGRSGGADSSPVDGISSSNGVDTAQR
ncbi:MAG: hypothetical protein Q9227_006100 [Pyrenula ochraceoflavens]